MMLTEIGLGHVSIPLAANYFSETLIIIIIILVLIPTLILTLSRFVIGRVMIVRTSRWLVYSVLHFDFLDGVVLQKSSDIQINHVIRGFYPIRAYFRQVGQRSIVNVAFGAH